MKNKKVQIVLLVLALAVVVIAGIVLLVSPGNTDTPQGATGPTQTGTAATDANWLTSGQTQYHSLGLEIQEGGALPCSAYDRFLLYQGQLCQLTYVEAGDAWQLTAVQDGQVLKTYGRDCFAGEVSTLFLDPKGNLWAICWDDSGCLRLSLCEPGCTLADAEPLDLVNGNTMSPIRMTLWEDTVILQYGCQTNGAYQSNLALIDRSNHTMQTIEQAAFYCMDSSGNLYCLIEKEHSEADLEAYSMTENRILWTQKDLPYNSTSLWYLDGGGLFLLSGIQEEWTVTAVNTKTGALGADLLNVWTDTDIGSELAQFADYELGISEDGQICFSATDYDLNGDAPYFLRYTWRLEAFVPEIDPAEVVTLTITAPYPVDSIQGSVRMYQRQHPQVQVVWDTQYASREEYQANALQYREQLAVRTMAGDVGDLQMIVGAGLSQDVITDTDVFMDLAPYLEQCSFREELEWNLLETLRGEDGAIRAVPLGIVPSYRMYNETLLDQLGNPIDPDTVTWSELLDLAAQWKAEGTDLSLISWVPGDTDGGKAQILTSLLLANLYGFRQEDGSVALDQPWFRELLETLKELWNSPQLIRCDGTRSTQGFFQKSLLANVGSGASFREQLDYGRILSQRENISVCAAPLPWGEVCKLQQGYAFCWGISSFSENKDAAWELLEFIISKDGLPGYAYSEETSTLNNEAQKGRYANNEKMKGSSDREYFAQLLQLRKLPISRFDEPYGWYDAVYVPIWDYLEGNSTLDEALTLAQKNWERFLMG